MEALNGTKIGKGSVTAEKTGGWGSVRAFFANNLEKSDALTPPPRGH
jgi:hypothetical protein